MSFGGAGIKRILINFHKDASDLAKKYHRPEIVFWAEAFWDFVRYGASPNDYIRYEFYRRNGRGVDEYITARRQNRLCTEMNRNSNGTSPNENKYATNKLLAKFITREWLYVNQETKTEEVAQFINRFDEVIVKPLYLSCGKGITKYRCDEITDISEFAESLRKGEFLIEEVIKQHRDMAAFNPYSVNTVRMYVCCNVEGGGNSC